MELKKWLCQKDRDTIIILIIILIVVFLHPYIIGMIIR